MGTREQALTALQRANRVRQERARMKAEFQDRELSPIAVINDCPDRGDKRADEYSEDEPDQH